MINKSILSGIACFLIGHFNVFAFKNLDSSSNRNYILLFNYNNACVPDIAVKDFYQYHKGSGNSIRFYVYQLETQYAKEYIERIVGENSVQNSFILNRTELQTLGITPSVDHEIVAIKNGAIEFRESMSTYFYGKKFVNGERPTLDSFPLNGDFGSLKYRNMIVHKVDSAQYILSAIGYENILEVYNKESGKRRDLLQELQSESVLKEIYKVQFGEDNGMKAFNVRNIFITDKGRIEGIKELDLHNVEILYNKSRVSFGIRMAMPDSSSISTTILVEYDRNFEIQNWWVADLNPYLKKYFIGISYDDNILTEGSYAYIPIFSLKNTQLDTTYNLAQFQLTDKNKILFNKLEKFYIPKAKQKILGTKMYNIFSSRHIVKIHDTLSVVYNIMPFVFKPDNKISDTLHLKPNLFVGDPEFKALRDSVRDQNGGFSVPYYHNITSFGDSFIIVAKEFGKLSVALYNGEFHLLSKVYFRNADTDIFPRIWKDQLIYLKRVTKNNDQIYIFQKDLTDFLSQD